ncbi:MAG: signal peptidase I [Eubacteriales bacterium]|nr:signal peptidase I [Eubacteriales bacterium]MDY2826598.1 signal peptidase I [Eubacteriales bacterium]
MKALKIARTVAVWLVVALAVFMMVFTAISVSTFDRADRKLFGYRAFVVLTDSMEKTDFAAGDLVLIKDVDPQTLKEGDIIAFTSRNEASYGKTITHKIRRLTTDADGIPGFVTYGTTTDTDDETVVTYPFVIGKYEGRVPKVGKFFQFLKSTPGYIVCILIPFMVLILLEGARCVRLFRKYKSEQQAEMKAERDRLAAERAETQRMMKELLEMKEKLKESGVQPQTGETPPAQEPKM